MKALGAGLHDEVAYVSQTWESIVPVKVPSGILTFTFQALTFAKVHDVGFRPCELCSSFLFNFSFLFLSFLNFSFLFFSFLYFCIFCFFAFLYFSLALTFAWVALPGVRPSEPLKG